jgi:glycosyltransferase involved in cell wall biosynthesis
MSGQAGKRLTIALMIESAIMGGAEMVVLRLAHELRNRGHTVHPVVPQGREGWLLDQFRDHGFVWETYDLRRPVDPSLPRRLADQLHGRGVNVMHSHEFVMAVYGAAAARRLGCPHVITMHGNQNMTRKWQRRVALRWAFRRSNATVAVSEDTRRHLNRELGLRSDLVKVVPNGVPVRPGDGQRIRQELHVEPTELLLAAVGNLIPRKGHALLLEALADLRDEGADRPWQLAIAGGGSERARLEGIIRDRRLEGRVHLLGTRTDVADLHAAADIFVMPSIWEGLPLAILESMFAGKAIVASDISGIPEAIAHEQNGLLTPPGDVVALKLALGRVMADDHLRGRLGRAALERAEREFTMGTMTDAYERLYVPTR